MSDAFVLDPRLAGDSLFVADLVLSRVLLMDDARFPWLLLVPRRAAAVEVADLSDAEQATLWREVQQAAEALRQVAPCDKLNMGALGNIVRQLHVHVVARREGDAAWPNSVWGHGRAEPYAADAADALVRRLQQALT
jgi:diadenosine tetraphosphate (Ap4A) HIT family hydrolase